MRILFCTDGSKISFNALKNFSKFTDKDVVVDVICIIDWSFLPDDVVIEESGFANTCKNVADTILIRSGQVIEELNLVLGQTIKHCGAVVESILEQLKKEKYDFVVMGSHGKKGFQRWLGSVSREVLEATDVPVYISRELSANRRVLFTTDGFEFSEIVVKFAIEHLNLTECEIHVCSVCENPDLLFLDGTLDSNWLLAIQTQQEIYAERAVNRICKILIDNNLNVVNKKVISGIPATEIIKYIMEEHIDLVVLGAKPKTKMQKFLLDSVSKRVIENVHCDSLILKNDLNN